MGELINLNRYRKQKQRDEAKQKAERKRMRHGRTKAEKKRSKSLIELEAKRFDEKRMVVENEDFGVPPKSPSEPSADS